MSEIQDYIPFKVVLPATMRYWEDDDTGFMIKKGSPPVAVTRRQFKSSELKFALMRNRLLITEGECTFPFRGEVVKLSPGANKNLIAVLSREKNGAMVPIEQPKVESVIEQPQKVVVEEQSLEEMQKEIVKTYTLNSRKEETKRGRQKWQEYPQVKDR